MTESAARPIRFVHRGALVEVADAPTTQSVLYWLRESERRVGTKEGCNEGDCGACMVIVAARDDAAPDGVALRPANACLLFVAALDGRALFTVDDLKAIAGDGGMHPAQRAMVACHGSQCGFCTPGFTMSLAACYDERVAVGAPVRPARQELADALSGNLCRCTGYRPILDAGEAMFDLPPVRIDRRALREQLDRLAGDAPLDYRAAEHAQAALRGDEPAWVAAPRSVDALAASLAAHPDARLVAGATDVALWVTKQRRRLPRMIRIDAVEDMKAVVVGSERVTIGAGASLEAAWDALVALAPSLLELKLRFASLPLRLAGTMGGNVANGSPIGDSAPVLLALDAVLLLRRGATRRRVPLAQFYLGYMANLLASGEFVEAIDVPIPSAATVVRGYKISKRYDCDISAVSMGSALRIEDGVIAQARVAFGGMDAVCRRAAPVEAALVGRRWDEDAVDAAVAALASDFAPLDDLRASAAYRLKVASNLLRRLWLETRADAPLAATATTVWPVRASQARG